MELKSADFLTDSPQFVGGTEFGLDNPIFNGKRAKELLAKKQETIIDEEGYEVFRTGSEVNGNIILYNKKTTKIDYLVAYEKIKVSAVGTFLTQVKLWRNLGPYNTGITSKIFFEYILKRSDGIMSDAQQTPRGKEFWMQRLSQAYGKGLKVGLLNLNLRDVNWYDPSTDFEDWLKNVEEKGWGVAEKYQAMRFVIMADQRP
jgi:hypothetical protein